MERRCASRRPPISQQRQYKSQYSHWIPVGLLCQYRGRICRLYRQSLHIKLQGLLCHALLIRHCDYFQCRLWENKKLAYQQRRCPTPKTIHAIHRCCLSPTFDPILQPNHKPTYINVQLCHPKNQHQDHLSVPARLYAHLLPQWCRTYPTHAHRIRMYQATSRLVFMGPHQDQRF